MNIEFLKAFEDCYIELCKYKTIPLVFPVVSPNRSGGIPNRSGGIPYEKINQYSFWVKSFWYRKLFDCKLARYCIQNKEINNLLEDCCWPCGNISKILYHYNLINFDVTKAQITVLPFIKNDWETIKFLIMFD